MRRLLFIFIMFLLVGCSQEDVSQVNVTDDVVTINQIDNKEVLYNDDYLLVTASVEKIAFYETQVQLYSLHDYELLTGANFKGKNIIVGLYDQGFYSVSLTSNKLTLYATDGTKTTHTINSLFQKEDWQMATLSPDASTLIYVENNEVKQYNLASKTIASIGNYQTDWEILEWKENSLYLKSSNHIIEIKEGAVNELLEVATYTYLSADYSIASSLEGFFEICDVATMETLSVQSIIGETVIDTNTNGMMTQMESDYYYYDFENMFKYKFTLEDVRDIHLFEETGFIVTKNDGTIQTYTNDKALKVLVVRAPVLGTRGGKYVIDVPTMAQRPNYPSGCETISTMMLLEYLGIGVDTDTFIDEYLDTAPIQYNGGVMYAPSPYDSFVGNPRTDASYGCMSPVIEKALIRYLGSDKYIENTTGMSLEELCQYYINRDMPVLVWASINMLSIYPTSTWITPDGSTYQWLANEHCLLLVGYDDYYYYFNDPWTGRLSAYSRSLAQNRYATFGQQSLTIIPH